jgi:flagellar hook-length control protein FliK
MPAPTLAAQPAQGAAGAAPIDAIAAPEVKSDAPKNAAPAEKSVTTSPQTVQSALFAPQSQTLPAIPAPAALAPTAPTANTVELPAVTIAPVQGQPAPDHGARQPKGAQAQSEAKPDAAAPNHAAAPASAAAPRANAKAAGPPSAAKDAAAFTSLLDAPEAAPQPQASSAPGVTTSPTQAQHAAAEQSATRAAPAAHQVAREIVRKFDGSNTRFELRLDPPELGRVEVRLDVSRDHRVTAVIAADSPQALTELARHARDLEQMLQGAGLELSDNGLSFDLRQGSERAETAEFTGSVGDSAALVEDAAPVAARPLGYERWRGVRVDMMV